VGMLSFAISFFCLSDEFKLNVIEPEPKNATLTKICFNLSFGRFRHKSISGPFKCVSECSNYFGLARFD